MATTAVMTAVTLRPIEPADEQFLLRVYASTRADELAPIPWSPEQKDAFLRQQFHAQSVDWSKNHPGADFSIIEVDGAPAGRFYVDRGQEEICLVDIALLPEHRRAGIGTDLIRGLLAEAGTRAVPVTIHVEVFNPARALYERLGFVLREERGMYLFMEWRGNPAGAR
jgi:ribosomal protein S18 acetylase RimI-like enzyme